MKIARFIAFRYIVSPKSHSIINLISWVAFAALAVPVAAMVIILSLHNGLSDTIKGLYNSFDSDMKITAKQGKFFDPAQLVLSGIDGIESVSYTIEDNVLIRKGEREYLATIKGDDSLFSAIVPIETLITSGKYEPQLGDLPQAVVGQGVAYNLGINPALIQSIDLYAMIPDSGNSIFMTSPYRKRSITPIGVYSLDEETDSRYVIVPLGFARELFGAEGLVSSAELKLREGADLAKIREKIGENFTAQTKYEQKESLYRVVNQEKWVIYAMLMMVLFISALSLAGAIITLVSEKKSQIATLQSLGASRRFISSVFRHQGLIILVLGTVCGMVLGLIFCYLQYQFGLLQMGGTYSIVQSYPVSIKIIDIVAILVGTTILGYAIVAAAVRSVVR